VNSPVDHPPGQTGPRWTTGSTLTVHDFPPDRPPAPAATTTISIAISSARLIRPHRLPLSEIVTTSPVQRLWNANEQAAIRHCNGSRRVREAPGSFRLRPPCCSVPRDRPAGRRPGPLVRHKDVGKGHNGADKIVWSANSGRDEARSRASVCRALDSAMIGGRLLTRPAQMHMWSLATR